MKKFASLALALVLALALAIPAFAAPDDTTPESGTITISNAVPGQTYSIYRLFDLESYGDGVQSYKINEDWAGFFKTETGAEVIAEQADGFVTWIGPVTNSTALAEFAMAALEYAKDNNIEYIVQVTAPSRMPAEGETWTVHAEDLALGYYLVDSSVGALCSLNVTTPTATIVEKNVVPSIDKEINVPENATIGDSVNYEIVVEIVKGAQNYVVSDEMGDGLTFNQDLKITLIKDDVYSEFPNVDITNANSGVEQINYTGKVYTGVTPIDGIFKLTFDNSFLAAAEGYTLYITYSATINENALIVTEREGGDGNTWNVATLNYGNNKTVSTDKHGADVDLYKFDLNKITVANVSLDGAEFELYDDYNNKIEVVKVGAGNSAYYRPAVEGETGVVIEAGSAVVKGLAKGIYWLEETKAPDGYNKLAERVSVVTKTVRDEVTGDETIIAAALTADATTTVVNYTGAELPSTGGIGTTIFYVGGGILVAGAAILLITKKRMGAAD